MAIESRNIKASVFKSRVSGKAGAVRAATSAIKLSASRYSAKVAACVMRVLGLVSFIMRWVGGGVPGRCWPHVPNIFGYAELYKYGKPNNGKTPPTEVEAIWASS